jgi:hypothetical protein
MHRGSCIIPEFILAQWAFTGIYPLNAAHGDVGERKTNVPELRAPDMTLRARTYRFRAFSQFTEARKVLLP